MTIKNVLLLGGSGFVGTHVANRLAALDINVTIPTRRRERDRQRQVLLLPNVQSVQANIHDPVQLASLMEGKDAVINLVGVLHTRDLKYPYSKVFAAAHVELPKKIVAAAKQAGVQRVVHMGALKAACDGPSEYLRSKADGEAVMTASGLDVTVVRPSVIFGPGDSFLNTFARFLRVLPRFYVGYGDAKFQPVYVGDVAEVIVNAVQDATAVGKAFDLVGPKVYTLRELVNYVNDVTGARKQVKDLSLFWAHLQAGLMSLAPKVMMCPDNLRSMEIDSIAPDTPLPYGITAKALESVGPTYLLGVAIKRRLDGFRLRAGR